MFLRPSCRSSSIRQPHDRPRTDVQTTEPWTGRHCRAGSTADWPATAVASSAQFTQHQFLPFTRFHPFPQHSVPPARWSRVHSVPSLHSVYSMHPIPSVSPVPTAACLQARAFDLVQSTSNLLYLIPRRTVAHRLVPLLVKNIETQMPARIKKPNSMTARRHAQTYLGAVAGLAGSASCALPGQTLGPRECPAELPRRGRPG